MINISGGELKQRIANKQITLDGEPLSFQAYKALCLDNAVELGDFLFHVSLTQTQKFWLSLFNTEDWATTNVPCLQEIFGKRQILKISKKKYYVI